MDYLTEQQALPITEPERCSAASGAGWIGSAWGLFKQSWLEFLVAFVLFVVIRIGLEMLPLGALAAALLMPTFMAGFLEIAHRTYTDNAPGIGQLFAGFNSDKREQLVKLLQLGGLSLLFSVVIMLLLAVALIQSIGGLDAIMALAKQGDQMTPEQLGSLIQLSPALLIWLLGFSVLLVLYSCAIWFATPLLWFSDKRLLESLQLSLSACGRNWLALLVFGLALFLLALVALIPLGLGLLVLFPVIMIATYTSFRQIFVDHGEKM